MAVPSIKQSSLHFSRRWLAALLALLFLVPLAHTAHAAGSWTDGGDMHVARQSHTATLLPGGQVLVAGGGNSGPGLLVSAELFNPTTGNWAVTGDMNTARYGHTATLLPNGKVLVAGGNIYGSRYVEVTSSAELYDPATGTWTVTGSLATARSNQTATLLASGKVLVAGGFTRPRDNRSLAGSELYDPATGVWTATGSLVTARVGHTATLLPNGKVLVAGGYQADSVITGVIASAELYDPTAGTWTATGSLAAMRDRHTATLLPNGKVLVAGGYHGDPAIANALASVELYDPAAGTWAATSSMSGARAGHAAILLPTGRVLVTADEYRSATKTELYDPATGSWADAGAMSFVRADATATLLRDGEVLVAGGINDSTGYVTTYYASTELYDPTVASTAPVITGQPADRLVKVLYPLPFGQEDSFSAVAGGNPTPSVQWQVSTDNGATFTNIVGATSSTYVFTLALSLRGNKYRAVFANSSGSATTNAATLTFTCLTMINQAHIYSPPDSVLTTSTPTFAWYGGECVTQYYLYVGSSFGSADLYSSGPLPASTNTATITPAIPLDGRTIYVRLWSLVYDNTLAHGTWQADDRTYLTGSNSCQNGTKADITSPTGSNITTGTPTIQWGGGACVSLYYLYAGSSFGGADLFASGPLAGTVTSATVLPAIPTDGRTIYVRLWSLVNATWQAVDHTYTMGASTCAAPAKADVTSPTTGTIHGGSQTFTWGGGACVTQYYLYIGSSYGSADLYSTELAGNVLSKSVPYLPTNGGTIYVRLWSLVNGTWQPADHSYVTAP